MEVKTIFCDLCGEEIKERDDIYEYYLGPKRGFGSVKRDYNDLCVKCAMGLALDNKSFIKHKEKERAYITETDEGEEEKGPTENEIAAYFDSVEEEDITQEEDNL